MNLYFRLLRLIVQSFFMRKTGPDAKTFLRFRVWPHDIDINGHLTNARYLSFMDLGRTFYTVQTGIFKQIIRNRWLPVANAVEITFIRELKPFTLFDLETRLLCWDKKYWYFEQRFMVNGALHAIAHIRGVFIRAGRVVNPQTVMHSLDNTIPCPAEPAVITQWKTLLDTKKEENRTKRNISHDA